ncbi:hypothetical protein Taro_046686 [Colocasia esculenta]|uniref:HMA domain-containing protein n=1 Tax=Colocasia esculenta TaxID=4460 RepID=A0A843X7J9_COLES|nr:hypothetical protein [Colocasia esculenta]
MASFQVVPMPKDHDVRPQYVEMKVPLYSYGCEKKVKKALAQLKGIHSVHVDYDIQKVTVWGICNRDAVLATIKKKRREARFWDHVEGDSKSQAVSRVAKETKGVAEEEEEGEVEEEEETSTCEKAAAMEGPEKAAAGRGFRKRRSWKRLLPLSII